MVDFLDDEQLERNESSDDAVSFGNSEQHLSPVLPWFDSLTRPQHNPTDRLTILMSGLATYDPSRETTLALRGTAAQQALDCLQGVVDGAPTDSPKRRDAIYLLIRLASTSNLLPRSLFVHGIKLDSVTRDPVRTGGFADIYLGYYRNCKVALKRLRLFEMAKAELHPKFCREALVWKQLKHPYVMPFIGVDADTFRNTNFLCMVSPWMERGTILDFIKNHVEYVPHRDCHRLLREILEGLCYLHAQKVVHGDINTANIFIDDEGHARLADFGLTIIGDLTANRVPTTAGQAGTVRWLPPEQLDTFDTGVGRRSTAGDIYAFGCLVVSVYTARQPFSHLSSDFAVFMEVSAGRRPARPTAEECIGKLEMSDELWGLVQRCWAQDMNERPTASEVLEWFVGDAAQQTLEGDLRTLITSEGESEESGSAGFPEAEEVADELEVVATSTLNGPTKPRSDTIIEKITRLQTQLDYTKDVHSSEEARAASILALMHFSSESGQFPSQLFLHGIELDDRQNPVLMGAYSDVYRAKYDGQSVSLRRLRSVDHDKDKIHKRFCQEALLWRQMHHPSILPVLGVDTETFSSTKFICAVSPWMSYGNILQYSMRNSAWNEARDFTRLLREIVYGLNWLHKHGIVHGDLHVNNVLVDDNHHARISGFSLSIVEDHATSAGRLSTTAGIAGGYMRSWAPERLARPPSGNGGAPTKPSDVYAFGMLIYQFWGRKQPFSDLPGMLSIKAIVSGKRPARPKRANQDLPEDLWRVVEACWRTQPGERPTVDNIETFFTHGTGQPTEFYLTSEPNPSFGAEASKLQIELDEDAALLERAASWTSKEGRGSFSRLFRTRAIRDYTNREGNITIRCGEIFVILDLDDDEHGRWKARLQDGSIGLVPPNLCSFIHGDFTVHKRVRAITSMNSPEDCVHHLSFRRGEEIEAGPNFGVWTLCRKPETARNEGSIGLIPSSLIR